MNRELLLKMAEDMRHSVFAFFLNNGHMTILALLGCVIAGLFSLSSLPIESEPEVKIPIGTVAVPYPGASPSDVEKLVTDEIEDQLKNLDDVKEITSESREGQSVLTVEFEADADIQDSIRSLRDEVETAKAGLPAEAEDPIVQEIRAGDQAIVTFTMVGNEPMGLFKQHVDELEDRIESIQGVNKVEVNGLPEKEMQVLVDLRQLEGFELSITDIARAISSNHIDFPVGSILTDGFYYQASLKSQFDTAEELADMVVATKGGRNIFLRDVATVREVFAETSSETRLYTAEDDTYRAGVALGVYKRTGEDLVKIVDLIKEVVNEYEATELPDSMSVIVTDDASERIQEDINRLLTSAWQTVLIIAIILFLALGAREALAAAASIPILYLISFVGLAMIGETFNFLTFFALILSLGVVVDTSIVIIEGVYENMQKYKMPAYEAALASISVFKAPLIAGTATTLAAFLPLGLMSGIMGEYVKHIPYTVNLTLLSSLFTALFILPAVAAWLLSGIDPNKPAKPPFLAPYFEKIGDWYGRHIHHILHSIRQQRLWLWGMFGAFIFSFVLLATGVVKFQLFASPDVNLFFVNINAPEGTALDETRRITQKVEELVEELPELKRFVSVYGAGASHNGRITVTLTDPKDRSIKSTAIAGQLRRSLPTVTEAEVLIEELGSGPPSGADIQVRILGDDIRELEQLAASIQGELADISGATDITNDLELSPGEYHLRPRRDRIQYFGLDAAQLGNILRTSVFGDSSVKINRAGEETDILVQIDYRDPVCLQDPVNKLLESRDNVTICRSHPDDMSELLNLLVPTNQGQVPLSELVEVELTSAVTTIRHYDRDRVVSVKANIEEGYVLGDVLSVLQERIATMDLPDSVTVQYGGENEDTAESMQSLYQASLLAFLLILVILVYQFKSFKQVIIIFTTMFLAFMGVLYGLALIRVPLSFPGMIGLVALFGIVVNDAIVLIDKINNNRLNSYRDDLVGAVETGVKQRLEPVIMTTATTALGVIPLIFSGETFRDLAIVVAVGITVATLFTLVMVPVLYLSFESGTLRPWLWPWFLLKRIGRVLRWGLGWLPILP